MENWKRYQNVLAHRWNVQQLEPVDEPPRPEFLALLKKRGYKTKINLITGVCIDLKRFSIPTLMSIKLLFAYSFSVKSQRCLFGVINCRVGYSPSAQFSLVYVSIPTACISLHVPNFSLSRSSPLFSRWFFV